MIYFDNAATTRALPSVAEKMTMMLCEQYGNPASVSAMGLAVEKEIRNAADIIARGIRAKNEEIFFTSGGTEGDNWAIYGTAEGYKRNGQHFITTQIAHPAVKNPMKKLEEQGCEVTWLAVDRKGHISLEELADAMECRCYHGGEGRTRYKVYSMGWRDWLCLALMCAAIAGIILLKVF